MAVELSELVHLANHWLAPECFQDGCPNGLQVEGKQQVQSIVSGVTASLALIEAAGDADLLLVHHGYFWKNESPRLYGMKKRRIAALLGKEMSLLAYHLPLDAHAEYGNNIQLAHRLDLVPEGALCKGDDPPIGYIGRLAMPMRADEFAALLTERLHRQALHIGDHDSMIHRIGWCTGAAQFGIEDAVAQGMDAYLTGEVSEQTVHIAREEGIAFFAAGHHATERYGVIALGEALAQQFNIHHRFIDIDNPV